MAMKRRARGRCGRGRWPFWTNPSAMRSCSGRLRPRCSLQAEEQAPIPDTGDHLARQRAMGIAPTLDADPREERRAMLAEANRCVENRFQRAHQGDEIIGESPALKEVLRQVEVVAPTDATVLLQGETGTGKELLARTVHQQSFRSEQP